MALLKYTERLVSVSVALILVKLGRTRASLVLCTHLPFCVRVCVCDVCVMSCLLGPHPQEEVDVEAIKKLFPYDELMPIEFQRGGMRASSAKLGGEALCESKFAVVRIPSVFTYFRRWSRGRPPLLPLGKNRRDFFRTGKGRRLQAKGLMTTCIDVISPKPPPVEASSQYYSLVVAHIFTRGGVSISKPLSGIKSLRTSQSIMQSHHVRCIYFLSILLLTGHQRAYPK